MSDEEQLFDDFEEDGQAAPQEDLFDVDAPELPGEGELLQEEEGEEPEPAAAAAPPPKQDFKSMKEKLAALAKSKRPNTDEPGQKKKKQKRDKDRGKAAAGGGGSSSRPQRLRRQRRGSDDGGQPAAAAAAGEELPEDELALETEADMAFIDDEGVPEDERYDGEDVEVLAAAEEAEEAAPGEEEGMEPQNIIDEVLARRKRAKRKESDQEIDTEVMSLVGMMQACADADVAAMQAQPPRPAVEKLKQLPEIGRVLRQRKYHETFLASKGLNALASWLKPYQNGTLPNAKIRAELMGLLAVLQLDTTNDYVRERLEESELGKITMFYYKNPNESMPLRSQCRDLIQAWSAPIFADNDEEIRKRRQRERAHRQRQVAEKAERERRERQELEAAERRRKLGPTDVGFRTRAAVPQPSKMDFVINPGSKLDPLEASLKNSSGGMASVSGGGGSSGSGSKKPQASPIGGRLGKVLQQRKRGAKDRIGGMSVEGRGIQL